MITFPSAVGLKFRWKYPDPPRVKYQLAQMEAYFESTQLFAEESKLEAQISMAQRFATRTEPSGDPWPSLKHPAFNQIDILQLTGKMREDSLSDEAWTATPVGVFFDTTKIPEYWVYHEQPRNDGEMKERIPQRRFIGLDAVTEKKIENRFNEWVAGGIVLSGKFVKERRNMLGQFASMG